MTMTMSTAATIVLVAIPTLAVLAMILTLALRGRRPAKQNRHLTGRRATPYWHSPTGLQDERAITALPDPPARRYDDAGRVIS